MGKPRVKTQKHSHQEDMSKVQNFYVCETSNSKNRAYQWQPQTSDFLHVQSTMMLPKNKILKLGTADFFSDGIQQSAESWQTSAIEGGRVGGKKPPGWPGSKCRPWKLRSGCIPTNKTFSLQVWQCNLHSNFQASLGYRVRPCLQKQSKAKILEGGSKGNMRDLKGRGILLWQNKGGVA